MKRCAALLAALCLMAACALPAGAASGFDDEVIKNAADTTFSEDAASGETVYFVESLMNSDEWYWTADASDALLLYPCITAGDESELFSMCFFHDARRQLKLDTAEFIFGGASYSFSGLASDVEWYEDVGGQWWMQELVAIDFSGESISMMDELIAHRSEAVTLRLSGADSFVTIPMDQHLIDGMIHLYNLYKLSGGLRAENIERISRNNDIKYEVKGV